MRDLTPPAPSLPARTRRLALLDREAPLGYLLVLPAVLYLAIFIAYPFFMSMYMSFTDAQAGNQTWTFVGPANYSKVENYEIRANDFVLATVPTRGEAQKIVAGKGSAKVATEPEAPKAAVGARYSPNERSILEDTIGRTVSYTQLRHATFRAACR